VITAYVLIQTKIGKTGQVARAAAEIDGVQQAQPVVCPTTSSSAPQTPSMDALGNWSCHGSRPLTVSRAP
jgi:hypothetical protein